MIPFAKRMDYMEESATVIKNLFKAMGDPETISFGGGAPAKETLPAKQLAEIGLSVSMVEKQPACGGLPRNRSCISEFDIPLHCNTTITEVFGHPELEAVALSDGRVLPCRTLLIAVGLVPEQELIIPVAGADWLHLCGNSRTVHPMVETVVYEGTQAGLAACRNIRGAL